MNFIQKVKKKMMSTPKGTLFFYRLRVLRERYSMNRYDDYSYIKQVHMERFGREINLQEPQTYQEKLQWLKLFYHDPILTVCSDKYAVREYLTQQGHEELLNECYGVYENANDIVFDSLPNRFVAKATHGSSWNLICTDKNKLDIKTWKKIMNQWCKLNLYAFGREWNYKDIPPRITIEKYLEQDPLVDYKFMCCNGEPKMMQINNDYQGRHYVDFYDMNWKKFDFTYRNYHTSEHLLDKPEGFEKMIELARELSRPFPFVRVDLYRIDGKTIFGELTFFPGGGLMPLEPDGDKNQKMLGDWIDLPEPNFNLELLERIRCEK